nr:hypothetical protein [uncultured Holophaga sp.]
MSTASPLVADIWQRYAPKLIYPSSQPTHPYYISARRFTTTSAGIRALHLLCHGLNRIGQEAYITPLPHPSKPGWTHPELRTPLLTHEVARYHAARGITPIVVYPETVSGNPLKAPVVARWVLNFPGLLGGDTSYAPEELVFGYSSELAEAAGHPDQVLYMPTIDTRIFHPPVEDQPREGSCFYASKYKGKRLPITATSREITRNGPGSPTPGQIADMLRRAEVFYAYENTALSTEAVLCGCPAVLIPNEHFDRWIGNKEVGKEGYAWGTSPEELEKAKQTLPAGIENYLKGYEIFWDQLALFVEKTQRKAGTVAYNTPIFTPDLATLRGHLRDALHQRWIRIKREALRLRRKWGNPRQR